MIVSVFRLDIVKIVLKNSNFLANGVTGAGGPSLSLQLSVLR